MAQAGARGVVQIVGGACRRSPAQSSASARSTTGANSCSNAQGSASSGAATTSVLARALQRRLDPDCVVDPGRHGGGSPAANGGEFRQHLTERQSISIEPPSKQRPVATGATSWHHAARPLRSEVGIAFLPRQRLEIVGQEFVDGGGLNDQALKKSIHARLRPSLCAL